VCVDPYLRTPLFFSFFFKSPFFTLVFTDGSAYDSQYIYHCTCGNHSESHSLPKMECLADNNLSLSLSRFQERGILCIHAPSDLPERYTTLSRLYKQKRSCIRVRACILYIYVTRRQRTSPPSSATSPPRSPRDTPRASPARTPRQCYSNECSFSWATTATTTSKSI